MLCLRATTNRDLPSLLGFGERGITVQKTIHVAAPVEQVFAFWTDYQNFPRFMHNVREVRPVSENRSHWVVAGPAGVPVQWTAEVTRVVPGALIEWCSVRDLRRAPPGRRVLRRERRRRHASERRALLYSAGRRLRPRRGGDLRRRPEERDGRRPAAHEVDDRNRHPPHDAAKPQPRES